MVIRVCEYWSKSQLTRASLDGGWSATRVFGVVGSSSQTQAMDACGNSLPGGVNGASIGSQHPQNARLICTSLSSDDGVGLRMVTATYAIPETGIFDPDPLKARTRWRWKPGNESRPRDTDKYGNPKVNSARTAFRVNPVKVATLHVQAIRNEPFYDVVKAIAIQNTTSSLSWNIPLAGETEPGQVFCECMECLTDVYEEQPFATVAYNFEIQRGRKIEGTDEYDAFFDAYLDVGSQGWASSSSNDVVSGRIVTAKGDDADEVLLDGLGRPVDSSLRILLDPKTNQVAVPETCPTDIPDNVLVVALENGSKQILFRDYDVYDFNDLKLS